MAVLAACVVFLGPPGVGKGTQAIRAAARLRVPAISTGDMFREASAQSTPLGEQVRGFMDRGDLVPDDVVIAVVRERIARADCARGFLLDGFPRTVEQATALDAMLADQGRRLDAVVAITAPADIIQTRLGGRRTCAACNASYHVTGNPPAVPDVCDRCAAPLTIRPDDQPGAIQHRLQVYLERTAALFDHYDAAGLLRPVDGAGSVEEVAAHVADALA
jgi:adenylate kinase